MNHYNNAPETVIIFTSFGRDEIAIRSLRSLMKALEPVKHKVKVIVSSSQFISRSSRSHVEICDNNDEVQRKNAQKKKIFFIVICIK